jgi:hypothetical protein
LLGNRVCCRRFREKQISSRPFATPFGGRRRAIQGGRLLAAPVHLREDSTLYRAPLNMRHVDRAYAQAPEQSNSVLKWASGMEFGEDE